MPTPQDQKQFEELLTDNISLDVPVKFLDTVVKWIGENMEVDQVFKDQKLNEWAASNGYVRE